MKPGQYRQTEFRNLNAASMIYEMINCTYLKLTRVCAIAFLTLATSALTIAQDKPKTSYGLLLDSTGSMRSQFGTVLEIGKAVVHQTVAHGPISIFNFESQGIGRESKAVPVLRIEQSQDEARLNRTIDGLYLEGGQTTLLDAIQFISDRLQEWAPDSEKVIVVVSDGEDRVSKVKSKDLIQQLKERQIKVFAVGLVRELESEKRPKATKLLTTLTGETGGRAVLPKGSVNIQDVVKELAIDGTNPAGVSERTQQIMIKRPKKLLGGIVVCASMLMTAFVPARMIGNVELARERSLMAGEHGPSPPAHQVHIG